MKILFYLYHATEVLDLESLIHIFDTDQKQDPMSDFQSSLCISKQDLYLPDSSLKVAENYLLLFFLQSRVGSFLLLPRNRSGRPALLGPRPSSHHHPPAAVETEG